MRIVVFEDALVPQLDPMTLGRAAYSIQCGSLSLADWLAQQDAPVQGCVRPHLAAWQAAEYPRFTTPDQESRNAVAGERTRWSLAKARSRPCANSALSTRPGIVLQGETSGRGRTATRCTSAAQPARSPATRHLPAARQHSIAAPPGAPAAAVELSTRADPTARRNDRREP